MGGLGNAVVRAESNRGAGCARDRSPVGNLPWGGSVQQGGWANTGLGRGGASSPRHCLPHAGCFRHRPAPRDLMGTPKVCALGPGAWEGVRPLGGSGDFPECCWLLGQVAAPSPATWAPWGCHGFEPADGMGQGSSRLGVVGGSFWSELCVHLPAFREPAQRGAGQGLAGPLSGHAVLRQAVRLLPP